MLLLTKVKCGYLYHLNVFATTGFLQTGRLIRSLKEELQSDRKLHSNRAMMQLRGFICEM